MDILSHHHIQEFVQTIESYQINGLLFQHILLCHTRTWLHYHKIDCAHLNRHMQKGILLHEISYQGMPQTNQHCGIPADLINWKKKEISEVKHSRSREDATISQLLYYLALISFNTQTLWQGLLRYPKSKRTKKITLNLDNLSQLSHHLMQIINIIKQATPPQKQEKSLCRHCSYSILCWGNSTEDYDYY